MSLETCIILKLGFLHKTKSNKFCEENLVLNITFDAMSGTGCLCKLSGGFCPFCLMSQLFSST